MLKRLRCAWDKWFVSLKLSVKANKYLLLAVFIAGALGLLFAISSCIGAGNGEITVNIFIQIQNECFSFFEFFFHLCLYYLVFAVLLFLSACHFYFMCASFVGIFITSIVFCKGMIFSVMFDGFSGFAFMIFYLIPLALVYLFTFFLALKFIYTEVGYPCSRKRFCNINYYKKPVLKRIFKMLLYNLAVDLIFTVIIAIFAAII